MTAAPPDSEPPETESDDETADIETLQARIATLEDEADQLRRELRQARRTSYRRTAIGLALLGLAALGGAAVFPGTQTVLLALGGTGLFAALLTYYLTPERFVAASVSETVYTAFAETLADICVDLELSETRYYVPVGGDPAVRLYVPTSPVDSPPDPSTLAEPFVITDTHRGLATTPTGDRLRAEFTTAADPLPDAAGQLVAAASDALIEQFELVAAADADVDAADGRATVRVTDPAFGTLEQFDHPVGSFIATTLAVELDVPVTVSIEDADRQGRLVTCRWDVEKQSLGPH